MLSAKYSSIGASLLRSARVAARGLEAERRTLFDLPLFRSPVEKLDLHDAFRLDEDRVAGVVEDARPIGVRYDDHAAQKVLVVWVIWVYVKSDQTVVLPCVCVVDVPG
jgi:hypothetical protein